MRRVVESIPGYDGPPVLEDPFPAWEYLRKNYPVYYDAVYDNWVVTQYHDVVACLKDNGTFSVQRRAAANSMETIYDGRGILDMDGREHDAHRSTYAADLVGQRLAAMRPAIERNAHDLIEAAIHESAQKAARDTIDQLGDRRSIELVSEFCAKFPILQIMQLFQVPRDDHGLFYDWYERMMGGISAPAGVEDGIRASREAGAYLLPLITERRKHPATDVISKIATATVDGRSLSDGQVLTHLRQLMVAGGESTGKGIANLWWNLLQQPEQLEAARADPEILDRAFTEMMRHSPPLMGAGRTATRDTVIHGQPIPAGASVVLSVGSANNDDQIFANPRVFDVNRKDLYFGKDLRVGYAQDGRYSHLGFGLGSHFCVGYQVARVESVIAARELLRWMKRPRFKDGVVPRIGSRGIMWSVERLEIEFD